MSRHDGVSCDSCLKGNFKGRRYKCLICYDYDLCSACYESGATNTRHTTDHPMQCILTRADYDLYYGGEALTNLDLPQSYTCPYCCRMGFTDITLQEHVSAEHADISFEVVCPLCAAMPGGDPNLITDDFAGHLTLEHRSGPRDLISFLDEPNLGSRHNMRRVPHSSLSGSHIGRGSGTVRPRRANMHFSVFNTGTGGNGGIPSLSPSSRESVDPIAELLSQLSGVRRSAGNSNSSTPTQLQQLQMQLQLERQQMSAVRQQLERFPRKVIQNQGTLREPTPSSSSGAGNLMLNPSPVAQQPIAASSTGGNQFLLSGALEEANLSSKMTEQSRQPKSQFVQELMLSVMTSSDDDKIEENPTLALDPRIKNLNEEAAEMPNVTISNKPLADSQDDGDEDCSSSSDQKNDNPDEGSS